MTGLKIVRAKPNPAGKDRIGRNITSSQQLAGEWFDIKNNGEDDFHLNGLRVYHLAYKLVSTEWEKVIEFDFGENDILPSGKILRVHSGNLLTKEQLLEVDQIGADYHEFTKKDYVWNNDKIDKPSIWNPRTKEWIDQTWYRAFPPDGAILKRINGILMPL